VAGSTHDGAEGIVASDNTEPTWLTVKEVAARLRRPVQTLYGWRHRGYGPKGTRMGSRLLYRRTEVERWERQQERAS
jgi:excisionase family DNA binding protein